MANVQWDAHADAAMSALEADPSRDALVARINAALDELEANPASATVRRRRYHRRGLWGIPFRDGDDDWLLLWRTHPDDEALIIIQYLGPDI